MNERTEEHQPLTLAQVEELCRLYLDGSLDTLAETELEYILPMCSMDSDLIRETRAVMEISRSIGRRDVSRRRSLRGVILRVAAVAACAAVAVLVSIPFFGDKDGYEYIAYVNGQRVEGFRARQIAIDMQQRQQEIDADFDAIFRECSSANVDSLFSEAEFQEQDIFSALDEEITIPDIPGKDTVI